MKHNCSVGKMSFRASRRRVEKSAYNSLANPDFSAPSRLVGTSVEMTMSHFDKAKHNINFAKKDVVVVLGCVVFLLMGLGAVGDSGRRRAKEVVCLSNLRQWSIVCQKYTENNDGLFWSGLTGGSNPGYYWPWQLEPRLKDWKINRIWFCPAATKPLYDEQGNVAASLNYVFNAWGIYGYNNSMPMTDAVTKIRYESGPNGISGSYGLNGYVLSIPTNGRFEGGRPASDGWRTPNVEGGSNIPVFVDCLRFDTWPLHTNRPAQLETGGWGEFGNMARCCINRHNGAVNVLFMDWSARKVGLKELWTLKWHKSFNTKGPMTLAGDVWPTDWPLWMRNFKDY